MQYWIDILTVVVWMLAATSLTGWSVLAALVIYDYVAGTFEERN